VTTAELTTIEPRRRGRPLPAPGSEERIRREAAVGHYRAGDDAAGRVARAFGVTDRTLRRWARQLAAR
jgi:transposase-like protein